MALNWAMVDADGTKPVPLPEEKIWHTVTKCQMSLDFKDKKAKWEAKGTAFVTNQRVVFLRQPMLPAPAENDRASEHLRSLNVPLSNLVDCRYMIPVFAAPYYEAGVLPVPGGNLPNEGPGVNKGILKIWFLEGGGNSFRDAVEEVRNLAKGGQHGEQLPAYQARPSAGGVAALQQSSNYAESVGSVASGAATATSSLGGRTVGGSGSSADTLTGAGSAALAGRASTRAGASQLDPEELEAAKVALQHEEAEREAIRRQAERDDMAPGVEASYSTQTQDHLERERAEEHDLPPAYGATSPAVTTFVRSSSSSQRSEHSNSAADGNQVRGSGSGSGFNGARAREAVVLLLRSAEGRDRALQLIHGLALLTHRSFGSVRRPRFWGLWPVPHVLFLLFPRYLRRETLRRVYIGGEAAENLRKVLLLSKWITEAAGRVAEQRKSNEGEEGKGKQVEAGHMSRSGPDGFNQLEVDAMQEPTLWHHRLEGAVEVLTVCGEAADVAAFLGGSSVVWRIARAGYAEAGHKALRARQRRGLERLALGFELVALLLQLYTLSMARKRCRRALGRIHRQSLLHTDKLADAQQAVATVASAHPRTGAPQPLISSSPHLSHLHPLQSRRHRQTSSRSSSSPVETAMQDLDSAESCFQRVRHSISQMLLETRVAACEAVFAGAELLLPNREKEGLEAWTALLAGGAGMLKSWREEVS